MRQHMGFHILQSNSFLSTNPCGFCGCEAGLCRSWLEGSAKTAIQPRTKSALLRGVTGDNGLMYSHASAKKMSAAAPCTNHLVSCT